MECTVEKDSSLFSIDHWYPLLKKSTVKTEFIRASPSFVDYILSGEKQNDSNQN